jgi:hypothetical protein
MPVTGHTKVVSEGLWETWEAAGGVSCWWQNRIKLPDLCFAFSQSASNFPQTHAQRTRRRQRGDFRQAGSAG